MKEEEFVAQLATAKGMTRQLSRNLPQLIDPARLGVRSRAPEKVLIARGALIWRTEELARNACSALEAKDFAVAAILTRAILENAALTWKLKELVDKRADKSGEELDKALMRALLGSKTWEEERSEEKLPPYNVLTCLDTVTKTFPEARPMYDSLSEIAHPNWEGVSWLYSKDDREKIITYFGRGFRDLPKHYIVNLLCVALHIFVCAFKAISDALPQWISELEPF